MIRQLLEQLSGAAPEVCERTSPFNGFRIGLYSFWCEPEFQAQTDQKLVTGSPAHAWLRDALETAIAARGWGLELQYWPALAKHVATIYRAGVVSPYEINKWTGGYEDGLKLSAAEALLAAFIAAMRAAGEGVR